jgi:ATP adenylyltransferase
MPVVGDTKVIVEALEDTYDRLHDAFAAHPAAVDDTGGNDDDDEDHGAVSLSLG